MMIKHKITYQLVPPHLHRANTTERVIRTWKNHFIAILCGLDPAFPLQLWDRLLEQTNLTLNLLRVSRINPKMVAESMLNGPYNFNRTPIAPLGTKVLIHEKPAVRGTWAPHAVDRWYIGPARNHYRSYNVYIPSTKGTRYSKIVEFFPHLVTMPATSSADLVLETAKDLTHLLANPAPASPFASFGTDTSKALAALADIFSQLKPKTSPRPVQVSTIPQITQMPTQSPTPAPTHVPTQIRSLRVQQLTSTPTHCTRMVSPEPTIRPSQHQSPPAPCYQPTNRPMSQSPSPTPSPYPQAPRAISPSPISRALLRVAEHIHN